MGKVVEFEEVRYGMLMMVLCDREGRVYDVWIALEVCMRLGHSEKGRKGVYGLWGLRRIVWCMEIGDIGVV